MNEEKARLRWRCRRGMREVELLLEDFLEKGYQGLEGREHEAFSRLLEYPDQQLMAYLYGRAVPADEEIKGIVTRIRAALS